MSDAPQADGWWQASDGKWYPPEQHPNYTPPLPPPPAAPPPPTPSMPQTTQQPTAAQSATGEAWWKRWWVIALGGLVLLIVLVGIFAPSEDDEGDEEVVAEDEPEVVDEADESDERGEPQADEPPPATSEPDPTATPEPSPTPEPTPVETVEANLPTTVSVGDWDITVLSVEPSPAVLPYDEASDWTEGFLVSVEATYRGEDTGNAGWEIYLYYVGLDLTRYADTDCRIDFNSDVANIKDQNEVVAGGTQTGSFCLVMPPEALGGEQITFEDVFSDPVIVNIPALGVDA